MVLSKIGKIVKREIMITPKIRQNMNLNLDIFTIMPNHFHCIIEIGRNDYNQYENGSDSDSCCRDASQCVSNMKCVSTIQSIHNAKSNWFEMNQQKNNFGPQSKNLGAILRGIKGKIKSQVKNINPDFGWL